MAKWPTEPIMTTEQKFKVITFKFNIKNILQISLSCMSECVVLILMSFKESIKTPNTNECVQNGKVV